MTATDIHRAIDRQFPIGSYLNTSDFLRATHDTQPWIALTVGGADIAFYVGDP